MEEGKLWMCIGWLADIMIPSGIYYRKNLLDIFLMFFNLVGTSLKEPAN